MHCLLIESSLIRQWNNEKESQKDGIIVLLLIRLWGGWRGVVEVTNIVPGNFICLLTLIGYKPTVSRDILCIKINRMFPPQKMAKNVQNFICDNIQSISIIFVWEFLWFWFFGFFRFFRFFVWFRCPLSLASSQQPLGFRRQMRVLFDTLSMMPVCLFLAPLKDRVKLLSRYVLALPVKWISICLLDPPRGRSYKIALVSMSECMWQKSTSTIFTLPEARGFIIEVC